MRTKHLRACLCVALLAAALFVSGCGIFDGDDGGSSAKEEQAAEFKPLTSPDNLIDNLVLSYIELDIEEYARLLLREDEGDYGQEYHWFFQASDVPEVGAEYWDRETDIDATNNLFQAAKGMSEPDHPVISKLELTIYDGTWDTLDTLWGEDHPGVKYTKRQYYVSIFIGDTTIYGDDYVEFYLVPIQEGDVTTYRIALAIDELE